MQEELLNRHQADIPYQSLTWLVRRYGLKNVQRQRSGTYHHAPGQEMQHDTSPHRVIIAGRQRTAQCAALVLAHSRRLFVQYYPRFTRFECRVFLAEALAYMDGACRQCVIDNTSVIIAHGAGPMAVINPEMETFSRLYGFTFMAHRVRDPNRKAHVERAFSYIEGNFLAGRVFDDWQDINRQARRWCDETANTRHRRALGMTANQAWIAEKEHLLPMPPALAPVCDAVHRVVDTYGFVHLDCNRYSVPETLVGEDVEILKFQDKVEIYHRRKPVASHRRVIEGRDRKIIIPGHHSIPGHRRTKNRPCREEQLLLDRHPDLDAYVAALKKTSRWKTKMRRLLDMQRTYPQGPFLKAVSRALHYRLYDLNRLERIILQNIAGDYFELDS